MKQKFFVIILLLILSVFLSGNKKEDCVTLRNKYVFAVEGEYVTFKDGARILVSNVSEFSEKLLGGYEVDITFSKPDGKLIKVERSTPATPIRPDYK